MYKTYSDLKKRHPNAVLLFRIGDFYKAYLDDADKVVGVLEIGMHKEPGLEGKPINVTWFPHHALDIYLPKMIRSGMRVAICDQLPEEEKKEPVSEDKVQEPEPMQMKPEPKPVYKRAKRYSLAFKRQKFNVQKIGGAEDAVAFARKLYGSDIGIYESAYAIFLNRVNLAEGYATIGQGGVSGTVVDIKLVCKYALDTLASGVILVHNHPSGVVKPSKEDDTLTSRLRNALKTIDVKLVDSIILAPEDCGERELFYSFNDEGKI